MMRDKCGTLSDLPKFGNPNVILGSRILSWTSKQEINCVGMIQTSIRRIMWCTRKTVGTWAYYYAFGNMWGTWDRMSPVAPVVLR